MQIPIGGIERPLNVIGLSLAQKLLITLCDLTAKQESHFAHSLIRQ